MNAKIITFFTLFAVLIGCALCNVQEQDTIKLHVYPSSNNWWIAVDPRDESSPTVSAQLRDSSSARWIDMMYNEWWGYFYIHSESGTGFQFPLSLRLTAASGEQATVQLNRIVPNQLVDTKIQYSSSATSAPTEVPTDAPTTAPTQPATEAPTQQPATDAPTQPATQAPTQPATQAPTQPATQAPTQPATNAPTQPATQAPTQPATQAPTQPATQAPTQPATQAPTQPAATQAPTPATQAPTQPATQAPTQPATQAPTQKPTQPATQAPTQAPTQKPTSAPTQKPTQPATQAPTQAPTQKPTSAPTQKPTSAPTQPATQAPTQKPTSAPTQPATQAPTQKPTSAPTQPATQAPTTKPTTAPVDLCTVTSGSSEPVKILVPLYVYPGAAWDKLIAAAQSGVKIIAIINPNSGPNANGPDSAYTTYMKKFKDAGVEMVGYVHTSWGARSITTVTTEIGTYATKYAGVSGIFFDEASTESKDVAYYRTAYNSVLSKGFVHSILNPGVQPDKQYLDISSNIVIFENYASELANTGYSSWVTCAPSSAQKAGYKYKFSAIIHTASQSSMPSLIAQAHQKGMGLVYVTDGAGGCCTYNTLTSYFTAEASSVKSINA